MKAYTRPNTKHLIDTIDEAVTSQGDSIMTRPNRVFEENRYPLKPFQLSPVEIRQAELPKGNGDWPGFAHVWTKLQEASHYLAQGRQTCLSADHVECMAVMGSGHEETMKHQLSIAYAYGWAKTSDIKKQ